MKDKVFTVKVTRYGFSRSSEHTHTGTLAELKNKFSYTLECGKSWEHERGNKKINTDPKSISSLISNLNKAAENTGAHYPTAYYELIDTVQQ